MVRIDLTTASSRDDAMRWHTHSAHSGSNVEIEWASCSIQG